MSLLHILIFAAIALAHGALLKGRGRNWLMLIASVLALYWLQPSTPIRHLDFWLSTASLALTIIVWAATRSQTPNLKLPTPNPNHPTTEPPNHRTTQPPNHPTTPRQRPVAIAEREPPNHPTTLLIIVSLILLIALNRTLAFCCLTPTRPPGVLQVTIALALIAAIAFLVSHFRPNPLILIAVILFLFIALKTDSLAHALSAALRALNGQDASQASPLDIRWLGFSYLAFRLIHVLRERASGKLPDLSLQEFVIYTVFFPAITAGPIDRVERFVKDLRAPFVLSQSSVAEGGWRILWGVFKKFALADTLALVALNEVNAAQVRSAFWMWALLYAYAFRLYFDFSGYTDIALGLARLLGVTLPDNFDRPYLSQNLTAFWNGWHITLAQWFRAHYFNPLTRALRSRQWPPALIIAFTQLSTMILIGLWHGVTWNFVAWGVWHGIGLFIHNRWADSTKPRAALLDNRPLLKRAAAIGGALLTFHFVALGWAWFALPEIGLSLKVLRVLFGR
ncbi:MAG: MBOAT family protein [Chloroflexi bacterium]|nr:MBOAT family protein [Chloroflexota bacterium]